MSVLYTEPVIPNTHTATLARPADSASSVRPERSAARGVLPFDDRQVHQTIADLMPSGMFYVDLGRRIRFWNRAAVEITGLTAEAVLGRTCDEVIRCQGMDGLCPLQGHPQSLPVTDTPCTFLVADRVVHTLKSINLLRNPDGEVIGGVECFVDLTHQREAETALREAEQMERTTQQAKREFMDNMTHEIRTPMNGILGVLDLLLNDELAPHHRENLQLARLAAGNLMRLIDDLLDFSIMEKGALKLENSGFSLRRIVAAVCEHQRGLITRPEVVLEGRIEEQIPDNLLGDSGRLYQVLNHLMGNAVKFTKRGGISLEVGLAGDSTANPSSPDDLVTLWFNVSDTGTGIAKDKISSIFRNFTQGDGSNTRAFGGVGLGLNIARRLIALQGGQIKMESREGEGTTVSFYIPYKAAASSLERPVTAAPAAAASAVVRRAPAPAVASIVQPESIGGDPSPPAIDLKALRRTLERNAAQAEEALAQMSAAAEGRADPLLAEVLFRLLLAVRRADSTKTNEILNTLEKMGGGHKQA